MNALRDILPDSQILAACRDAGHEFRKRLLTPVVTVFHMIAAALCPEGSFRSAWQSTGAPPISSGSLADARARLPLRVIEAALAHGEEPSALSFSNAMRLVTATSQKMSEAPVWRLRGLYEEMLAGIAAEKVPKRPGRNEPRAIAREKKHYPRLRIKRAEWRRRHAG